jgi:hypothetical protein
MSRARLITRLEICVALTACLAGILAVDYGRPLCYADGSLAEIIPNRRSPDNLLDYYATAHERQDIIMYQQALHDLFRFELIIGGVGISDVPPERVCFKRAKAIKATRNMFNDGRIGDIDIDLLPVDEWTPCSEVCTIEEGIAKTFEALRITLDPVIHITIQEPNGESWIFGLHHTWLHITVVPDPNLPGSWVILRIREELEPA